MLDSRRVLFCFVVSALLQISHSFVTPSLGIQKPSPMRHSVPLCALSETTTSLAASSIDTGAVTQQLIEAVIATGVPTVFALIVIAFAAFLFRGGKKPGPGDLESTLFQTKNPASMLYSDLYGNQNAEKKSPNFLRDVFSGGKDSGSTTLPKNLGIPANQYIKLTNLNEKYDSYRYSVQAATSGRAVAAATYRKASFFRVWQKVTASSQKELLNLEKEFLSEGGKLLAKLQSLQTVATQKTVDAELKEMGLQDSKTSSIYEVDASTSTAGNKTESSVGDVFKDNLKSIGETQKALQELELKFVRDVIKTVGPDYAVAVRTVLLGDVAVRGAGNLLRDLQQRPLARMSATEDSPKVFVARFAGDTTASQVSFLREEATAIIGNARPGIDEVVVVLQTGGGTVTGYGLSAAQLLRFKSAGLKLTVVVEEVAASGGYMMCCVADHIVASPFAVLGSIGVISDIPNVYERLKQEGIEFQTVTAGKYKRTITPTKKVTKEDLKKSKEDVEDILVLFRDFVAERRPKLDIDKVATGEVWFGTAALDLKLCDEISTADDTIARFVEDGYNAFEVKYEPPVETPFGSISPAFAREENDSLIRTVVRMLVKAVATEIKAEIGDMDSSLQRRYLAQDDSSARYQARD